MRIFKIVFSAVFLLIFFASLPSPSEAAVPGTLTYQGRLSNSSGLAITGQVDITFNIYNVPTGGAPLWTQTITGVTVANGIFTVTLGTVANPVDATVISGADVYIGVKVGTDAEMMPRQKFAAVPYSVKASEADTVVDGAITAAKLANICSTGEVLVKSGSTWTCAMPSVLASCYNGDFVSCYGADPATIGVGPCRSGIRTCNGNSFSAVCLGEVTPVTETCDGTDEDCNGVVDDAPGAPTWYGDADNDTFGSAAKPLVKCTQPAGYVSNSTDCGDANEFVNPVRPEICDGLDNDCNSQIDDSCVTAACTSFEQSQVFECGAMCGGSDMMCIADCLNSMGLTAECHGSVTTLGMCVYNIGDPACFTNIACWRQTCSVEYGAAFGPECKSGVTRSCGPGTEVGVCQSGTETCVSGFWSGVCAGAVYQAGEVCDGLDNDCNGVADENPAAICGSDGSCVSGACQCSGGFTACSSQCVNTDDDVYNCGACGNNCTVSVPNMADAVCSMGACQYVCYSNFQDCNVSMTDGCETDTLADTANCGACGNDCASQVGAANGTISECRGGLCGAACSAGFMDCDYYLLNGCEIDVMNDQNNCGWCGISVDDYEVCTADACVDGGAVNTPLPDGTSCGSGLTCLSGFCYMPTCFDMMQNGSETDVDCGGVDCAPCASGLSCSANPDCMSGDCNGGVCVACGDGMVAGNEQCDDGNAMLGDGCSNMCATEFGYQCAGAPSSCQTVCGDGMAAGVEQCDDGNTMSGDGCQSTCVKEPGYQCSGSPSVCQTLCGDGMMVGAEQCDDGNFVNSDACTSTCASAVCGDGIVRAGVEQCDDGNASNADSCTNMCTTPVCGDGIVSAGEQCDDGNASNADSCTNTCTMPTCSDAMQNGSETDVDCGGPDCAPCGCVPVSDFNSCTSDICVSGTTTHTTLANGTMCDDGNACTQGESCFTGVCAGGSPVVCTALDSCHDSGTCDPSTGLCSNPMSADGTPCGQGGSCQSGVCALPAGSCNTAADCPGSDTSCQARTCVAGVCGVEYAADGTPVAAQTAGNCQMTVCDGAGGTKNVADDADVPSSNQCADGVCTAGVPGMQFKADGTACADGDACTQTDVCQGGTCTGGSPVTCVPLDSCHDAGTCDPGTGQCSNPAKADGTACTEGGGTECSAGVCSAPAVLMITPGSYSFGAMSVGAQSSPYMFTVTNVGGLSSGVLSVWLAGVDSAHFVFVINTCTGAALTPSSTCSIGVFFKPMGAGGRSAMLNAAATPGGAASATLSGTGI